MAAQLQDAILNSAHFSRIATDAQGVIRIFNAGAERMLGWTAPEVLGRHTPADFCDAEESARRAATLSAEHGCRIEPGFEALVWRATQGGEDIVELTHIRKDGSRFPALMSITALRGRQDDLIGYLLVATDNSTAKRIEADRHRLDRALQETHVELQGAKLLAEKASLAKSDFLSSMSHELRSPLNAILGFAQLIDTGLPAPTAGQKASVDQILQAGWYLLELINEILDLALIESGKLSLSLESMSLSEVLADCLAMIEPQALKSGITLDFPHFAVPCFVKADRTRVKQVFINLLSNAIKYNRAGGRVEVRVSADGPLRMGISFHDTGQGLAPDRLAQLFQPFNRLGQENGPEEGTGIGLVVSKRLVELMGGLIDARSVVGEGSVFHVELVSAPSPQWAAGPEHLPAPAPRPVHAGAPRHTVLCIEDNPANLLLVDTLMARRGDIRLLSARDGPRGVELARAEQPDVILMDINLPGISGLDALYILSGDRLTSHIPVVALSANAMPRDIERGLQAGFHAYLTKPIKVPQFMATLDLALAAAADRKSNESHP